MGHLKAKTVDDKKLLVKLIYQEIEQELERIVASATEAHSGATHEDAVAKSKYETHGLELSYLAGAQYERANLLKTQMTKLLEIDLSLRNDDSTIDLGTVVETEEDGQPNEYFFLSSVGAGHIVQWQAHRVKVLSPESPLGDQFMASYVGDEAELGPGNIKTIIDII